jgi:hypothetical protein
MQVEPIKAEPVELETPPKRDRGELSPFRGRAGPSTSGSTSEMLAILLAVFGLCLTLFYWDVYNTAVGGVHNIGLMQNREVGIMIGLACAVVGTILAVVCHKR